MALVLREADLVDSVPIGCKIHRLAQVVVEFRSREPIPVMVISILHHALSLWLVMLTPPATLYALDSFQSQGIGEGL